MSVVSCASLATMRRDFGRKRTFLGTIPVAYRINVVYRKHQVRFGVLRTSARLGTFGVIVAAEGISMKKALLYASAAAVLAAPIAALAEDGWYGSLKAAYTTNGSLDVSSPAVATALPSSDRDLGSDWGGAGSIGYGFGNTWRLEGELAMYDNELDGAALSSGVGAQTLMANLFYDFPLSERFKPYLGVGLGALRVDATETALSSTPRFTGFSGDDTALGVQGLAGLGIQVSPNLILDLGYRYLINVTDLSFNALRGTGAEAITSQYDADYTNGLATVGLRWQFAAPPPPPAPPAPPPPPPPPPPVVESCPTAQFVVYFEFNKSDLTPEASAVLDRAVADAAKCNYKTVNVSGNTDTSGSAQYNEGLSASRAQIVADGLTARGVAASLISQEALGESKPAVATQDGVKEPLNRRTEVVITFQ